MQYTNNMYSICGIHILDESMYTTYSYIMRQSIMKLHNNM